MSVEFPINSLNEYFTRRFIDYLAPSHHRRGIMSTALKTLIEEYAIPRMNCHRIFTTVHYGNEPSLGVFRKNGFVQREVALGGFVIPEQRGGGTKDLRVLDRSCILNHRSRIFVYAFTGRQVPGRDLWSRLVRSSSVIRTLDGRSVVLERKT